MLWQGHKWLLAILLAVLPGILSAQSLTVAAFNIHYITPNSADYSWPDRRDAVRRVVGDMGADILAFQEMETFESGHFNPRNLQLDWVLEHYPEYQAGAIGDPEKFPSTQPILYRYDRFELLDQGWFFYSETPGIIYSRTFNDSYPAFTSWVLLRDSTNGRQLRVMNNHFDYASGNNRRRSAELVAEFLEAQGSSDEAVVVLGDFNAPAFWSPMPFLRRQGLTLVQPSGGTYHFNRGWALLPAIDHILVNDALVPQGEVKRFTQAYDGVYPADHYPIMANLEWQRRFGAAP